MDIDAKENVCDPMYAGNSDLLLLIKSFDKKKGS